MQRIRVFILLCVLSLTTELSSMDFVRGNCNGDASTNIADAIFALGVLFPGPNGPFMPGCLDACDANDDGLIDLADPIFILSMLKPGPGGPPVLLPPTSCGIDPTADNLDCDVFTACP